MSAPACYWPHSIGVGRRGVATGPRVCEHEAVVRTNHMSVEPVRRGYGSAAGDEFRNRFDALSQGAMTS